MKISTPDHTKDWPARAWGLAALGALCGRVIYALTNPNAVMPDDTTRLAIAVFLTIGALAFAYTVERARIRSSAVFAGVAAAVMALIVYFNGAPNSHDGEPWRLVCGALSLVIAAPLFMAWRDGPGGREISYVGAHNRAWTCVVLWFASWVFVGIVWALSYLIAALFDLIGLDFLTQLLRKGWFGVTMTGAALGGAIGVLRDREDILGTLQRVVTTVLSVLAPVLAAGLIIFLIALPFTGLAPLWQATKSTTPILIGCVIGALILANAVIRDAPEDEARLPVLRYSAMALGFAMLPLGVIAAISTGLRIDQYGLTPDRMWAVVFAAVACAYGLTYLYPLARARMGWAPGVRTGNLRMAIGICVIAFVLATPLFSFGAISTRDQIARLNDGRTSLAKFDWAALRFDFGPAGKAAVERLAKTGATPAIRTAASDALKIEHRWQSRDNKDMATLAGRLIVLPKAVPVPEQLKDRLVNSGPCSGDQACALFYAPGATEAIVTNGNWTTVWRLKDGKWREANDVPATASKDSLKKGPVEIRTITRRQVFVGDRPAGQPFE